MSWRKDIQKRKRNSIVFIGFTHMSHAIVFPLLSSTRVSQHAGKRYVYDRIRKKHVVLTPEEGVRQRCIDYLVKKRYRPNLISVEKKIDPRLPHLLRPDIIIHDRQGQARMIIECKAPPVSLTTESVTSQLENYQWLLNAPYLMLTNGVAHFVFHIRDRKYHVLTDIPPWNELIA